VPLLRQLAAARADAASPLHRRPVVLLADLPKPALEAQLGEALKGVDMELYARSGQPWRLADLRRVCAPDAKCIILLEPCMEPGGGGAHAGGAAAAEAAAAEPAGAGGAAQSASPAAGAPPPATAAAAAPAAPARPEGAGRPGAGSSGAGGDAERRQQALKAVALMALLTVLDPGASAAATGSSGAAFPGAREWLALPRRRRRGGEVQRRTAAGAGAGAVADTAAPLPPRLGPRVIVQVPSASPGDCAHLVQRSALSACARGVDIAFAESSFNRSGLLNRWGRGVPLTPVRCRLPGSNGHTY
jgi:hypothetical protein